MPRKKNQRVPRNVRVLSTGQWQIRVSFKDPAGVRRSVTEIAKEKTAKHVKDRVKELNNRIADLRRGELPLALSNPVTFSSLCDRFSEVEMRPARFENGRKTEGRLSLQATQYNLAAVRGYFGSRPFAAITFNDLRRFKQTRLDTPVERVVKVKKELTKQERDRLPKSSRQRFRYEKLVRRTPRSIRSVNYEISLLRSIFAFAVRERWLERSPFADGRGLIDVSAETRRHVTWTREEEAAALSFCTGNRIHMKAVIICITDGGFRRSELLNARWKTDVDFENGIMLAKSYKRKSRHVRPVFMTDRMKSALKEWRALQPNFVLPNGTRPDLDAF